MAGRGQMVAGAIGTVTVAVMTGRSMVGASAQVVRRGAKTVRVAGQRGRQERQVICQSCCRGGCGCLVIRDLLLLELRDEVLGRMEVLARFSRAFALDEVDANSDERVLAVHWTVRGRMRERALAGLLLASSVLEITANLRRRRRRRSSLVKWSFTNEAQQAITKATIKMAGGLVHAITDYGFCGGGGCVF